MSMTSASAEYFRSVAKAWNTLRSGFFGEAVRTAILSKAYLHPGMTVADMGAGTGFLAVGLAPLVQKLYVFDGSPSMMEEARKNLADFHNVEYGIVDGLSLPLPGGSLDVVFANMYLHHIPDPLAAIEEMARLLRPGGRLVISDLDEHPYSGLMEEMADFWPGFKRSQIKEWFRQAGLVNRLVDCTGQSCCIEVHYTAGEKAEIGIFVAVGTKPVDGVKQSVQASYTAGARRASCCGDRNDESACCGEITPVEEITPAMIYPAAETAGLPEDAVGFSLGCGNPTAFANLKAGEVVVDIGCGGGLDVFLAARRVGLGGRVIGVDMTPEMLERARGAAKKIGLENVEFREGEAQALPLEDAGTDVILSNCVINLAGDKGMVFEEAYRVLRPDGRLEVSDIVTDISIPWQLRQNAALWASCVSGALPKDEYLDLIAQAGFEDIQVQQDTLNGKIAGVQLYSITISAFKNANPS